jgi:hypothetical protein
MSTADEQYTLERLAQSQPVAQPFPHLLVRDIFEPALYRRLLAHLLPAELMRPIKEVRRVGKKYSDARFVFPLTPDSIGGLPTPYRGFWQDLHAWLMAPAFAAGLFTKFGEQAYARLGGNPAGLYHQSMLVDDRTRYSLGPHTDFPAKVITVLIYLPADDARPHLGTSIYRPRDGAFRCAGGPHYPFEHFERVATMPYLPNTLFAFFKTDDSFHGVEPIDDGDYRRHVLHYDIKHEPPA